MTDNSMDDSKSQSADVDISESLSSKTENYSESDEIEEEEDAADSQTIEMKQLTREEIEEFEESSTRQFTYLSIADSLLSSINAYRNQNLKDPIQEDNGLYLMAQENSKRMAKKLMNPSIQEIQAKMQSQPYLYYSALIDDISIEGSPFTDLVNQWVYDTTKSKLLLYKFNCAGAGVWVSTDNKCYFTVILAQRSYVGLSYYSGPLLKSLLIATKCLPIVNQIRKKDFGLFPITLNPELCEYAYSFSEMDPKDVTNEIVEEKIGNFSEYCIRFSKIVKKSANPYTIVQQWMNEIGKNKSLLGNFNRVGYGFAQHDNYLQATSIYVRSIRSSVVDNTEKIYPETEIANILVEALNEFRGQHSLQAMMISDDLTDFATLFSTFIANGRVGNDPLEDSSFKDVIGRYKAHEIIATQVKEMGLAPQAIMKKIRERVDVISILLNYVDDVGIGIAFDKNYVCYVSIILCSYGQEQPMNNLRILF